jgi:hyperosmotically inducible periplasmic protein
MRSRAKIVHKTLAVMFSVFTLIAVAQDQIPASGVVADSAASRATTPLTGRAARTANRTLVKKVSQVLARTRGLDSSRILIRARDGVVMLSGTVPDSAQVVLAVDAAQKTDGVRAVQNQLRITTRAE